MSCNNTFTIKEWTRGDYFESFSLTFQKEPVDFIVTGAGLSAKKDAITVDFDILITPEKPNVVTFSLPSSASTIPAGRYRIKLYVIDGTKKRTLAEGSWIVK
jgi:hypothetical protein